MRYEVKMLATYLFSLQAMLRQYGPDVPEASLKKLVTAFSELRQMADEGLIAYPYSTREVVNIVKHLQVRKVFQCEDGHHIKCSVNTSTSYTLRIKDARKIAPQQCQLKQWGSNLSAFVRTIVYLPHELKSCLLTSFPSPGAPLSPFERNLPSLMVSCNHMSV